MSHHTNIFMHDEDLPDHVNLQGDIAVDTETMGLNLHRDRLCLVQLSSGDGTAHLVKFSANSSYNAPNLKALLADNTRIKLYHYARFDLASIYHYLGIMAAPLYCTRTVSRLVRTYTDKHGLQNLCAELLDVTLDKQKQSSDWGHEILDPAQQLYAASDVLYLHALRDKLNPMLIRANRQDLAQSCFEFLPTRAKLDLAGWPNVDILAHS